jgi:hypothetical protein
MKSFLEWVDILEEGSKKEQIELEKLLIQAGFVNPRSNDENWWEKEVEGVGIVGMSVTRQPKIPAKQIFNTAMGNFRKNVAERQRLQQKRIEEEQKKAEKKKKK